MQKHLIIFIKNPVLGTVKTRLARSIGEEAALEVYIDLMNKCKRECSKVDAERHLFYSKEIVSDDVWSPQDFHKKLQVEGGLGEKISAAFENVFEENGKVLIIGSDCYDLSATIIEKAFSSLNESDVVIGPANDGGYYLLGINKFEPELFEKINWSTESVLVETLEKAKQRELSVTLLEELVDIDNLDDLEKSGYNYKKEVSK